MIGFPSVTFDIGALVSAIVGAILGWLAKAFHAKVNGG